MTALVAEHKANVIIVDFGVDEEGSLEIHSTESVIPIIPGVFFFIQKWAKCIKWSIEMHKKVSIYPTAKPGSLFSV